jgi:hypothetical protein
MVDTARRSVAKTIASIEKQGGLMLLDCGCIVGMRAKEMRKLIEVAGPEEVVKIIDSIKCNIHPAKKKKATRKRKSPK